MEKPIDLPIAVCVSKIDLLVNQNPMGTQAVPFVAKLRETMGLTPNLRLVHERSQLTAMALPQMFPGWNVEREPVRISEAATCFFRAALSALRSENWVSMTSQTGR